MLHICKSFKLLFLFNTVGGARRCFGLDLAPKSNYLSLTRKTDRKERRKEGNSKKKGKLEVRKERRKETEEGGGRRIEGMEAESKKGEKNERHTGMKGGGKERGKKEGAKGEERWKVAEREGGESK